MRIRLYLKKIIYSFFGLSILLAAFGIWLFSLLPESENPNNFKQTRVDDLVYFKNRVTENRGKILAIVTSTSSFGSTGKHTGYELTELSRAYYIFTANGFHVDIASPMGGEPPVVIDGDDIGKYDFVFLNDKKAQGLVKNTLALSEVYARDYQAIYFVGGKGAMYDFPNNNHISRLLQYAMQEELIIGAVCHGPAALVNVKLKDNRYLLEGRKLSSFTNKEELLLMPNAKDILPFLLQSKIEQQGASFQEGPDYLNNVVRSENLVTGQNPWSVWELAESMIKTLGYKPIDREHTGEENSVDILLSYEQKGYIHAKEHLHSMLLKNKPVNRHLLGMHIVVGILQGNPRKAFDLLRLLVNAQ